jgi:hypothetical protein
VDGGLSRGLSTHTTSEHCRARGTRAREPVQTSTSTPRRAGPDLQHSGRSSPARNAACPSARATRRR